ncbi:hypothetical protein KY340_00275 [Candidatus Woesearchaeota archaeon]|nr:hypothetical protein [Candidatus Woesearchaeota archaeon]
MGAVSGSVYQVEYQFKVRDVLAIYAGRGVHHTPPHELVGKCARLALVDYGINKLSKGISLFMLEEPYKIALGNTPLVNSLSRVVPIQKSDATRILSIDYHIGEGELVGSGRTAHEKHVVGKRTKEGKNGKIAESDIQYLVRFNFEDELIFTGPNPFATVREHLEWLRTKEDGGVEKGAKMDDLLRTQLKRATRIDIIHWLLKIKGYQKNEGWLF